MNKLKRQLDIQLVALALAPAGEHGHVSNTLAQNEASIHP